MRGRYLGALRPGHRGWEEAEIRASLRDGDAGEVESESESERERELGVGRAVDERDELGGEAVRVRGGSEAREEPVPREFEPGAAAAGGGAGAGVEAEAGGSEASCGGRQWGQN